MKKSTKGALAASAAGVLLLGGAGSLAYWTASDSVDGGTITSGELKLTAGDCDDWTYAAGAASAGDPVALFVPGDKITTTCTFALVASGDNLSATVAAPATVTYTPTPAAPSLVLTPVTTYAIDGPDARTITNGGTVTSADGGQTITATFNVTIPYGTNEGAATVINGNDTQGITATLDELTVTLTQVNPNT